ncbi:MAG: NAD(P)/FAD-dependent oxidoreductase [Clostridia bacterium]|nr:NAD(P)/FAD-dependent oxidoreductase [Clostridia bacterium]
MERWQILIVGNGPAGISAAITSSVRKKSVLLLGPEEGSGKVRKARKILNYPGLPEISGEELAERLNDHVRRMNIPTKNGKAVAVYAMGTCFAVQTAKNEMIEAQTVILATGVSREETIPGEEELLGSGVSYCATCDAPLCQGKRVAVAGSSEEDEAEALLLKEYASEVIYLPQYETDRAFPEGILVKKGKPVRIEKTEEGVSLVTDRETIPADQVFLLRESLAPDRLVPGLRVENGHVATDRTGKTSLPGLFVCGDAAGTPYQYVKAAGEGNVAALSAVSFLDRKGREETE